LKTTVAESIDVDLAPVVIHEIRVVGSRCGNMRAAVDVLAARRVDPTDLIAARYALARADQALFRAGAPGMLKVLIEMI
jgi:threonine dehydrogenase-like Zn-dependent dehydrogenase